MGAPASNEGAPGTPLKAAVAGQTPLVVAMAMLSISLGVAVSIVDALTDYLFFMAEYAERYGGVRLIVQFILGTFLYILAASLYFGLVFAPTARYPRGKRSTVQIVDLLARLVIVLTPTVVLFNLFDEVRDSGAGNWVFSLALLFLALSIVVQALGALVAHPIVSLSASSRLGQGAHLLAAPAIRIAPLVLPVSLVTIAGFYIWVWIDVIGATAFVGGLGVLFLFFVLILSVQRVIAANRGRAKTLAAWLIMLVLVSHFIPFGARPSEFRHEVVKLEKAPSDREEFVKARGVPEVSEAFERWLQSRDRYKKADLAKDKYPVFIVSAQGGGQYAAYHTALFLARLYDHCPRLKDHVFAISGVSGGSVGAAVLAEMLRNAADLDDRCSLKLDKAGKLETAVAKFFSSDFVTPVIASGLLLDLPGLLIPQLQLAPDRAATLEQAFERAWQRSVEGKGSGGLDKSFYGRWSPEGHAPALFFNTTSSNYGVPVVISERFLAEPGRRGSLRATTVMMALRFFDRSDDGPLMKLIGQVRGRLHEAI